MNTRIKRYGVIFLAMNLVGIAVALFLQIQLGSDSIGLLCDGLNHVLPYSYGTASLIYNLVIIAVAYLVAKKYLGEGTIVYALLAGYFIDFYSFVFAPLSLIDNTFIVKILYFMIGEICLSTGLAILIELRLGMNALDAILTRLSRRFDIPYAYLRTISDFTFVVIGTTLGGTFGVGTIISVLTTGFFVTQIGRGISRLQCVKQYSIQQET